MFFSQAASEPPIETTKTLSPRRIVRMHLRRALPVLRPVVVITPNPDGGRSMKNGSSNALRTRPPCNERTKGLWRRSATYLPSTYMPEFSSSHCDRSLSNERAFEHWLIRSPFELPR